MSEESKSLPPLYPSQQTRSLADLNGDRIPSDDQTTTINQKLAHLAKTSRHLNEVTDQLTKDVEKIEQTLRELDAGVEAAVHVSAKMNGRTIPLILMYGKKFGKWGFIIVHSTKDVSDWVFKDAPREYRLKVVDKIPELLELLLKQTSGLDAEMTEKAAFVQNLATTITVPVPTGSQK